MFGLDVPSGFGSPGLATAGLGELPSGLRIKTFVWPRTPLSAGTDLLLSGTTTSEGGTYGVTLPGIISLETAAPLYGVFSVSKYVLDEPKTGKVVIPSVMTCTTKFKVFILLPLLFMDSVT